MFCSVSGSSSLAYRGDDMNKTTTLSSHKVIKVNARVKNTEIFIKAFIRGFWKGWKKSTNK